MSDMPLNRDEFNWQLPAEAITVRIRWFGLCMGYVLVNLVGPGTSQSELNAILTLGAVYAIVLWAIDHVVAGGQGGVEDR